MTNKNLDPTVHGFDSVENLILSFDDLLLTIRDRAVMLKDVDQQLQTRARPEVRSRPDVVAGTRDEELYQLATRDSVSTVVSPALRSVRQETMFKGSKLKLTGCLANTNKDTSTVLLYSRANELREASERHVTLETREDDEEDDNEDVSVESESMVMTSSRHCHDDIVTVETDTSDAESSVSSNRTLPTTTTTTTTSSLSRGRKKSRMAAFPFLE